MARSRKKAETVETSRSEAWRYDISQLWREHARRRLSPYIQLVTNWTWVPAPHLLLLCSYLERIERGEILRLIVTMPPRHGKSMVVSQSFPAWYLGRNPEKSVIITSYAAELAYDFSRACREAVRIYHPDLFGVQLSDLTSAVDRWGLEKHRGQLFAAGVGGPLTGRGASLLIIDDPFKNRKEAESPVIRQHVWDWYTSTFYTRQAPDAAILLVQTRWHHDDLAGRIQDRSSEDWIVVNLPAEAEGNDPLGRQVGDPLWPSMFPKTALETIRLEAGPYDYSALYQQRPVPREGSMFRRAWFEIVDAVPTTGRQVRWWDFAATKAAGDWTVGMLVVEQDDVFYIADIRRVQESEHEVTELVKHCAAADERRTLVRWEQEGGSSGKFVTSYLAKKLAGYAAKGIPSHDPKSVRAKPAADMAENGQIKVKRAPWNEAFFQEVEVFPLGANDDQVDCLSGAIEVLTTGGGKKMDKKYASGHHRAPV